jgi:tRNA pseudouridine55 synthase
MNDPGTSERASPQPEGLLLVDKPAGPTSHDIVAIVRRTLATRRVGHVGTLDPFATGLLVVLLGRSTRLSQFLVGLPKQYTGVIRLGLTTTTDDLTGQPLATSDAWASLDDADIRQAMETLVGSVAQRPPRFSAKSVGGRRAYRRARTGEAFELESRDVQIDRFDLVSREGPDVTFACAVASGVYVRSLARDLGERLGCGAHLLALRRTVVGHFTVTEAVTLDDLARGAARVRPPREAVPHLTPVQIDEAQRAFVRQGRAIPAPSSDQGPVALLAGEILVAVAESDGAVLTPSVVLES